MIRVGICDDDVEVRDFLGHVLGQAAGLSVVAVCSSGEQALDSDQSVDVWLMDIRMPGMGGRAACRELTARDAATKVLFLTSYPEEGVDKSLQAGAVGHLFKDESAGNLLAAVRAAAAGLGVGSRTAVGSLVSRGDNLADTDVVSDDLDRELVRLIVRGHSNQRMARQLCLSESGVKKRINRLMVRAGVTSRPMLMAKLLRIQD